MRILRGRQDAAPVVPSVPGQMIRGYLDLNENMWVDLTYKDERPLDVKMQLQNGSPAVVLDLTGDLCSDQPNPLVPRELLARETIGHYLTPFGDGVYKSPYALARAVDVVAKEVLGGSWARVQALGLFGRMKDAEHRLTVYAFLYTFHWTELERPAWKVDIQKVCVHD